MLRTILVSGAVLAVAFCAAPASARGPLLTGPQARQALVRWSLSRGMERAEVKRCKRLDRSRVKCQMVETGPWNGDPNTWANEVWSLYTAHRGARGIGVEWQDFVYEWN